MPELQHWLFGQGRAVGMLLAASLLSAACSARPYAIETLPEPEAARKHSVFVVDHGWHTDLAVPAEPLEQQLPALKKRFGTAAYYELGWGHSEFYQAREITTGMTFRAIFWPSAAVMRVAVVPYSPRKYFNPGKIFEICLNDGEFDSLLNFVQDSFYRDQSGNIVATQNGSYSHSQFYEAEGKYHLLNTSNKWTAKGLRSGGLNIWPNFKLTSGSVMAYLRDNKKVDPRPCAQHQ